MNLWRLATPHRVALIALPGLLALIVAPSAPAETLSSTSYQLLAGHPASAGHGALAFGGGSELGSTGYSIGQLSVVGYSGAATGLDTAANGFWPIVLGDFANIDPDGDGIASPFDTDDDGDGLLDTVESGRGVFVGPGDVGSSPVDADSDGDGFSDEHRFRDECGFRGRGRHGWESAFGHARGDLLELSVRWRRPAER